MHGLRSLRFARFPRKRGSSCTLNVLQGWRTCGVVNTSNVTTRFRDKTLQSWGTVEFMGRTWGSGGPKRWEEKSSLLWRRATGRTKGNKRAFLFSKAQMEVVLNPCDWCNTEIWTNHKSGGARLGSTDAIPGKMPPKLG